LTEEGGIEVGEIAKAQGGSLGQRYGVENTNGPGSIRWAVAFLRTSFGRSGEANAVNLGTGDIGKVKRGEGSLPT